MDSPVQSVTALEETRCFLNYAEHRTRKLRHTILGDQGPQHTTDFMEKMSAESMVDDIDDDGWMDVTEQAYGAPEEKTQGTCRLAQEPGPFRNLARKAREKAFEAGLEAAGLMSTEIKFALEHLAEDAGWLAGTVSADEQVRRLLLMYGPRWKSIGGAVKDLKSSFDRGKVAVRDEKASAEYFSWMWPTRRSTTDTTSDETSRAVAREANADADAGERAEIMEVGIEDMEDVSLDEEHEDRMDGEPEVIERPQPWEQ